MLLLKVIVGYSIVDIPMHNYIDENDCSCCVLNLFLTPAMRTTAFCWFYQTQQNASSVLPQAMHLAVDVALDDKCNKLQNILSRLKHLSADHSLVKIRHCIRPSCTKPSKIQEFRNHSFFLKLEPEPKVL